MGRPKIVGCESLALFDDLGGTICRPRPDKQVNMIGLDCQFNNLPTVLLALLFDEAAAVLGNFANEDRLSPLRTPDKMEDDEVDTMLVPLIFHIDSIASIYRKSNNG